MKNPLSETFELHRDRLATTDETGRRIFLYPADVRGRLRSLRTRLQYLLIVFFLALPWMRINGRQALLLDIAHRKFEFFGLSLRAHNAPLIFLVFATAGFGLFLVTSIWGRIWCGWACPQTVFIDGVFRRIERWIEGPALARRKLAAAQWTPSKIFKRLTKWSLFILASLTVTHSFLAYFVGTDALAQMVTQSPIENWLSFLFMIISSSLILFNFGWFREQFCVIVCPYGRLQSVLMDEHSVIVAYDSDRGEPRSTKKSSVVKEYSAESLAHTKIQPASISALQTSKGPLPKIGDCVNCYRCVQVCPTGIDIRRGLQMECIACTACMDACDDVMTKLKRPTGLIRYDTLTGINAIGIHEQKSASSKKSERKIRPRTVAYLTLTAGSLFSLFVALIRIEPVSVEVLRAKDVPYSVQDTKTGLVVLNHFKLELSNQTNELQTFEVRAVDVKLNLETVLAHRPWPVTAGRIDRADLFVRFPKQLLLNGKKEVLFQVRAINVTTGHEVILAKKVTLVGPLF